MRALAFAIVLASAVQAAVAKDGGDEHFETIAVPYQIPKSIDYSTWRSTSVCITNVYTPPPTPVTYTTSITYTKPGETQWSTTYCPVVSYSTPPPKTLTYTTTYTQTYITCSYSTVWLTTTTTQTTTVTTTNNVTIPTTIPTTVSTTIPTTIPTTVPTTIPTTVLVPVPTTIPVIYTSYSVSTAPGTTVTYEFTETDLVPTTITNEIPTTVTDELPTTITNSVLTTISFGYAQPTTLTDVITITDQGTTEFVTTTYVTTVPGSTVISVTTLPGQITRSPTTLTNLQTITTGGTTSILTLIQETTVLITQPASKITLTQQGPTVTLPGTVITESGSVTTLRGSISVVTEQLPGSTVTEEGPSVVLQESIVTLSGSVTTLPGQTIVESVPGETETIEYAASFYDTVFVTITAAPVTITRTPPPPASTCRGASFSPGPDGGACNGEQCYLSLDLDAAVHWSIYGPSPPLITRVTFANPAASATCITTKCNTAAFNAYYTQSLVGCARPPCPSNSLDCNCNIVVGPIGLANGKTTSVTQIGPSGWRLNLGATPVANYLPSCAGGNPQCITESARALSTSVLYSGDVVTPIPTANISAAMPTEYLLPQLVSYFPRDDPFGQCTRAIFTGVGNGALGSLLTLGPSATQGVIQRRTQQIIDPGQILWKQAPSFGTDESYTISSAQQDNTSPMTATTPLQNPVPSASSGSPGSPMISTPTPTPVNTAPSNQSPTPLQPPSISEVETTVVSLSGTNPPSASTSAGSVAPGSSSLSNSRPSSGSSVQVSTTVQSGTVTTNSEGATITIGGQTIIQSYSVSGGVVTTDSQGSTITQGGITFTQSYSVVPGTVVTGSEGSVHTQNTSAVAIPKASSSSSSNTNSGSNTFRPGTTTRPDGAVIASTLTEGSTTTGTDGKITIHDTVFYSQIAEPTTTTPATQSGLAVPRKGNGVGWSATLLLAIMAVL